MTFTVIVYEPEKHFNFRLDFVGATPVPGALQVDVIVTIFMDDGAGNLIQKLMETASKWNISENK